MHVISKLLAAALVIGFGAPVFALGTTEVTDVVFTEVPDSNPAAPKPKYVLWNRKWASGHATWVYNAANAPAGVSTATVVATVQAAMDKWSANCYISFSYGGTTNAARVHGDGISTVDWDPALNAEGQADVSSTAGYIRDADMTLNAQWVTTAASIDAVATHEAGHMLGLSHSDVQAAVMAGPPLTSYNNETDEVTLRADDIAGCRAIYGGPATPPPVAPVCILTANPASPTAGTAVTLSASCSNTPNSYTWTGCSSTSATCTDSMTGAGSRSYSVTALNAGGTSPVAATTVTWRVATLPPPPPPTTSTPVCAVVTNTLTPTVGTTLALSASCTGAPTSYAWTGCASAGSSCADTTASAGTRTYFLSASNASGSSATTSVTVTWGSASAPTNGYPVVEYYHAGFDHYFITGFPAEITALDTGKFSGWVRTGYTFNAVAPTSVLPPGESPVCRFYGLPSAKLDSHFYSASPTECAAVAAKLVGSWELESSNVFQAYLPNVSTGVCANGLRPLYRAWNQRADSNHRYTTDPAVQAAMLAKGYVAEGYGNPPVVMCVLVP